MRNILKKNVLTVLDNPFVNKDDEEVTKALYIIFRYCLLSVKCDTPNCPVAKLIGCEKGVCKKPTEWGFVDDDY